MFNPLMHLFSRIMHLYHPKKFYCMISNIGMIKKLLHYYLEVKTLHLMRLGVTDGHNGSTGKETNAFPIIFPSYREKIHWNEKQSVPFSDTNISTSDTSFLLEIKRLSHLWWHNGKILWYFWMDQLHSKVWKLSLKPYFFKFLFALWQFFINFHRKIIRNGLILQPRHNV